MVGDGKNRPGPPLSRAPSRSQASQKNLSRHVSFSETNLKQPHGQDSSTDLEAQRRHRKCGSGSICNMCCAWASFAVWTIVILLLIFAVVFFAFLQSNLPEFRIERLDVYKLNITTSKNKETLLSTGFEFGINATNKNDRIELHYGAMEADVMVDDINLGSMHISEFTQRPRVNTNLKVRTGITKAVVDEENAKDLNSDSNQHVMVVNLNFKGRLQFVINGNKMSRLPFKVNCINIEQSEIDMGHTPKCSVKITPFS